MSRKYKIRDQEKLYFVTFTIVEWIDLFTRRDYRDIFLDSLKFCQKNKGLDLCAFCIMSSHVHLIIGRNGDLILEDLIRDIKKFTSVKFLEAIKILPDESRREFLLRHFGNAGRRNLNNSNFQIWQQHSHPIELNTEDKIRRCLNYIHQNPVAAGIVLSPEDYLYSSASNYAELPDKLIDVILIG
ncbi:MAG: transposase [Algoriphagus sp.]|uniref:REP-associated tyrosine transposase n=1 Tax=Algoriphagus sp. TaxID=1872435 RepID=UPI00271D2BFD|nr:transposase [Algoriphagus sp.]MDO8965747.1 transposase [Algoriphagus sp.]MDP3198842.1 transposase [Algoriphagus sp.]MDP3473654.1 transposase [Algoriphagus sp.]